MMDKFKNKILSNRVGKFFQLHEGTINKVMRFSIAAVDDANALLNSKEHNLLTYCALAGKLKGNFDETFRGNVWHRFSAKWATTFVGWDTVAELAGSLLYQKYSDSIVTLRRDNVTFRFLIFPNFCIGWELDGNGIARRMQFEQGKWDEVRELIRNLFWDHFGSFVSISRNAREMIRFDQDHNSTAIASKQSAQISETLKKFLDRGIGRSILFYGPPGTGKSNLVRAIAEKLGMRAFRINIAEFSKINHTFIYDILDVLEPDLVILEDIDHAEMNDDCKVLAMLEILNRRNRLTLATTNVINSINHAVIRPGRFDELIEINRFDDEVLFELVGEDMEIFEYVQDLPIAFVMELMKRIHVLGRAEALKSVGDIRRRFENMQQYNCKL